MQRIKIQMIRFYKNMRRFWNWNRLIKSWFTILTNWIIRLNICQCKFKDGKENKNLIWILWNRREIVHMIYKRKLHRLNRNCLCLSRKFNLWLSKIKKNSICMKSLWVKRIRIWIKNITSLRIWRVY